jgi:hypothetical protein
MNDREYIQHENETSDWLVYAEYTIWTLSQNNEGMSQPKIEDRYCEDSQRQSPLTD